MSDVFENAKQEITGLGKMAAGAAQIASGIATVTGHGLIGGYLQRTHQYGTIARVSQQSVKSGMERMKDGYRQFMS